MFSAYVVCVYGGGGPSVISHTCMMILSQFFVNVCFVMPFILYIFINLGLGKYINLSGYGNDKVKSGFCQGLSG